MPIGRRSYSFLVEVGELAHQGSSLSTAVIWPRRGWWLLRPTIVFPVGREPSRSTAYVMANPPCAGFAKMPGVLE